MNNRKGQSRYSSLPEKTAVNVQVESLKKEFELAEKSVVGRAMTSHFNKLVTGYENKERIHRFPPGELLVDSKANISLPLMDHEEVKELAIHGNFRAYKENLQIKQLKILQQKYDPHATLKELWSFVNHSRLALTSTHTSVEESLSLWIS